MKKNTTRFLMALACALLFLPAAARADDYNYVVSFYLYLDGVLQNLSSLPTDDSVIEVDVLGSGQIHYHSYNITIGMFCAGICVGPEVGFFLHDADFFAPGATVDKWLRNGAIYEGSGLFYSSDDDFDWSVSLYLKSAGTQVRNPVSPRWDPDAGRRSGGGLLWGPAYQAASRTVDNPKSSAYPALLYSGEAFEKQVDFAVPGRGLDFVWSRIHRSSASADPYFGGEWSHNFDISAISLHLGSDFVYDVHMGNGITTRFRYHGYHAVKTPFCYYADGWDAALTEDDESGDVAILFGDGVVWSFVYSDVTDRNIIDEIADRFGNTLSFAYDAQDRLQTITDTLGRTYTISYNPDGTIASLTENAGLGRSIAYAYNGGNLETVTYPGGDTIGYTYDGENRLQTVTDGRGNVSLTNTYTDGFLTSQQHGSGPEAGTVAFTYTGLTLESGEARGTRTTDGAGHVTEHFFNSRNQLVRRCEIGPDETYTTRIAWESHIFNSKLISDDVPTQITLPDGVIISYQYAGLGTTAPAYTRRLNLTRIERLANDGSGTKLVTLFDHDDSLPVWDARFGETFVTRRTVRDKGGVLLERATYTYSTDGLATLDGIDYDGLPLYTAPHHHQEFAYNAQGQVTQHIHPKNPVVGNEDHRRRDTFAYTNGYLTAQVADADGLALKTSFEPDNVGRVQKTAAPNGHSGGVPIEARKSIFHWNHLDRLEEVEYPQTSATITQRPTSSFEHDANGNVTCIQRAWFDEGGSSVLFGNPIFDPEDGGDALVATRFDYDTRNRVTQVRRETDSVKNVTAYHYDANGNIVEVETPLAAAGTEPDNVVEYEYDARDLPVRIVRSGQVVTRLDYDAAGRVTRRIEGYGTPEARGWEYTYDSLGRLASGVDPVGLETQYVRDALGRATRVDAVGPDSALLARTDYGYDLAGRLTDVNAMHEDADGINIADGWSHVDLVFSDAGRLVSRVLEGTATQYAYDTVSRVASVTAASGDALEYAYDADGNVTSVTETALDTASKADAEFETEYEYDYLGRLVETRILGGATPNTAGYGYDSFGRPVVETDGRSNVTEYAYDPLGQLTEAAHDATGIDAAQLYGYDANGRLTIEIDPNSNETVHEYDILGRPVRTTYADGTAEEFRQYDAVGNPREHVAPNGLITHAAYDALGRPVAQHFDHLAGRSDPGTTTYAYDPLGRLVAAANDASVVTQRYDTLGNVVEESIVPEGTSGYTTTSRCNNKGLRTRLDPPDTGNTVTYAWDAADRITDVWHDSAHVAGFDYLGGRVTARHFGNGTDTALGYDPTGHRVETVTHSDGSKAALDVRTYSWDAAYNLDDYQVTGGPLAAAAVDYAYDGLNRLDPSSIGAAWSLDSASNRTGSGYTMTGTDALMHRYTTSTVGQTRRYDAAGALCTVAESQWHRYDALGRLVEYDESTAATTTALTIEPGDCTVLEGTWNWNTGDGGFLEETTATVGAVLRALPAGSATLTVEYRSVHDPADPDGDSNMDEADGDDYAAKYYAQILLAVDTSHAAELPPYHPYVALRVAPDQLALIAYDGSDDIQELDTAEIETAQGVWYTVHAAFDGARVEVYRTSETDGDPVAWLTGESAVLDGLGGVADTAGFTVGSVAEYHFRGLGYATTGATKTVHVAWTYDPFGRKVARTVYDGAGAVTSRTHYVYDGWQLIQERDADTGTVIAEYTYGPDYVDAVLRCRRGGQDHYYHTDQQHSTVALTDGSGAVVERYGYDAFGAPTVYDAAGTPVPGNTSAVGNAVLYTGRTWDPALGLYDYRNRQYDPALGRFTTPDPLGPNADWNNLGNPYTYTSANPGAFVDPYGTDAIDLIFTGQWNPPDDVAYESYLGAGLGISEGWTVVKNAALFGVNSQTREQAAAIQQEARARGDVLSQVGFGMGRLGVEAGYMAAGGSAAGRVVGSKPVTAFLTKHNAVVTRAVQATAVGMSAVAGWGAGTGVNAAVEGDWNEAVYSTGHAALATAFAYTAAQGGGDPVVRKLEKAARVANESVGPGEGPVHGTRVHSAFKAEIDAMDNPYLWTEVSYFKGDPAGYGRLGSIRVDVVQGTKTAPVRVFDLKTGSSALGPARVQQIGMHLPGEADIPVIEIR